MKMICAGRRVSRARRTIGKKSIRIVERRKPIGSGFGSQREAGGRGRGEDNAPGGIVLVELADELQGHERFADADRVDPRPAAGGEALDFLPGIMAQALAEMAAKAAPPKHAPQQARQQREKDQRKEEIVNEQRPARIGRERSKACGHGARQTAGNLAIGSGGIGGIPSGIERTEERDFRGSIAFLAQASPELAERQSGAGERCSRMKIPEGERAPQRLGSQQLGVEFPIALSLYVRRIGQDELKSPGGGETIEVAENVELPDVTVEMGFFEVFPYRLDGLVLLFHEDCRSRAAAQRFDAEAAYAGEEIEDARARQNVREAGKDRRFDHAHGRAQVHSFGDNEGNAPRRTGRRLLMKVGSVYG